MKRRCFRCARAVDVDEAATTCPACGAELGRVVRGDSRNQPSEWRLKKLGFVPGTELAGFLSKEHGVPAVRLSELTIDEAIYALVPAEVARRRRIVPVNRAGVSLVIAVEDPADVAAIDEVRIVTELNIEVVVANAAEIDAALERGYS